MKTAMTWWTFWAFVLVASHVVEAGDEPASSHETSPARIGVYDSRVVAYAYFWTDAHQAELRATFTALKKAEQSKDSKKVEALKKSLQEEQRNVHRQVFSTAPIDAILLELKDRLPEIEKKTGVSMFVSKWDAKKLKSYPSAEQIDVTDLLSAEFKPSKKHLQAMEKIKKAKPVSFEQADKQ